VVDREADPFALFGFARSERLAILPGDRSITRVGRIRVRIAEVREVGGVVGLGAELRRPAFGDAEVLDHRESQRDWPGLPESFLWRSQNALRCRYSSVSPLQMLLPQQVSTESSPFDDLFRTHYAALVRIAVRIIGDPSAAEEIASDVFLELLHSRRQPPNPVAWLRRSALNAAIDRLRADQRRRKRETETEVPAAAAEADPERHLQRARVRSTLSSLRTRDAQLLVARLSGWTYREIALALNLEESGIGTMIARAEKSFEKEYRQRYGNA
jgi:RNA polymerase sigma factor (sigma-70 family)